jgi:hypothetical protein
MATPRFRLFKAARRKDRGRGIHPFFDCFEERQLLSGVGFVQGFVHDNFGAPLGGATVSLYTVSPPALFGTTTSAPNGYYAFNNVPSGTYNVVESASGYSTSVGSNDIQTTVNPASAIAGNTEIQVTVEDLSTQSYTLDYTGNPYAEDSAGVQLLASSNNQASLGNGGHLSNDTVGQNNVTLAGNLGNVSSFLSVCSDLLHGVSVGSMYTVQPGLTPLGGTPPINTTLTANIPELAYLYNTYVLSVQSGAPGNDPAVNGAGLQLAIWALEYNPKGTLNVGNTDPTQPFAVLSSTPSNIISAANAYLTAAAGQSQDVYFLNVNAPIGPGHGQGMLCTDLLDFTNTPTGSPVSGGEFATIGFWRNKNGSAVLGSFTATGSSSLGTWLATTFPHLFGNGSAAGNLTGLTGAQIETIYSALPNNGNGPNNTYLQAFAVALGIYADTTSLGGQTLINNGLAAKYGFKVTVAGGGNATYNVGNNGAAFGVPNGTTLTVYQIMAAADANYSGGVFYGGSQSLTSDLNNVLDGINSKGDIS